MLEQIGFREKIIGAGVGLVLVMAGWYWFYYQAGNIRITAIEQEISAIEQQIQTAVNSTAQRDQIREEITLLEQQIQAIRRKIPSKSQLRSIYQQIEAQAARFNLVIDRYVPNSSVLFTDGPAETITKLPIQIWLRGTFFDTGRFLESFDSLPFLLRAGEIQITVDDAAYPDLDIFLTTYAYITQ